MVTSKRAYALPCYLESMVFADTRPEVEKIIIEGYRRMTPAQKLARVEDLRCFSRRLAAARIMSQHPDAGDREVQLRLGAVTLGRELMVRVFGWDPEREGY